MLELGNTFNLSLSQLASSCNLFAANDLDIWYTLTSCQLDNECNGSYLGGLDLVCLSASCAQEEFRKSLRGSSHGDLDELRKIL